MAEREGRPTQAEVEAASISTAIKTGSIVALTPDVVRCTRCGLTLNAPKSVVLEIGPVCRRREVAV